MYRQFTKSTAKTRPRRFFETAQGLVEYALILALVAVLALGAFTTLGGQMGSTLSNVGGEVLGADESGPPTAPPTPPPNPGSIGNAPACWAADFFWYSNSCHGDRGAASNYQNGPDCVAAGYYWYQSSGSDCHTTAPNAGNINNSTDCWANGFFWQDDNDCHSSRGSASDYDRSSSGCALAGFFYYGGECNSSAQPPPPPPNNSHQVGDFCNPPGFDNDGSWEWVTTWNPSGSGHWDASWNCDGSAR